MRLGALATLISPATAHGLPTPCWTLSLSGFGLRLYTLQLGCLQPKAGSLPATMHLPPCR